MKINDTVYHHDRADLGRGRIEAPIASLFPSGTGPIRRRWRVRFGAVCRVCWEADLSDRAPAAVPVAGRPWLRVVESTGAA